MKLEDIKQKLMSKLGVDSEGSTPTSSPESIRMKQVSMLGIMAAFVIVGVFYLLFSGNDGISDNSENKKLQEKKMSEMTTPFTPVNSQDIWTSRVEKRAMEAQQSSDKLREENKFMQKRLDVMEYLVKSQGLMKSMPALQETVKNDDRGDAVSPKPVLNDPQISNGFTPQFNVPPISSSQPNRYPIPGSDMYASGAGQYGEEKLLQRSMKRQGPKIARLGGGGFSGASYKNTGMYLPAGSYSKAVLTSGVAASTSTSSQGNPQPVVLRLVDNGNLPRGFKSRVKDAVLTGACYGDISSERAICRLETMAWVEMDGTTIEKKVEGWVIGEDGRAGLRGQVVDRSGEVVRESFAAGIMSAISNFIKYEATSAAYPISPLGVTNALSGKDMLQGAAASGAGNAFDKLAEFSIRRAEQMQPVIMIASGRVVDVVFKAGIDLSPESMGEMKVLGSSNQNNSEIES